ncbi:hypothetical protein EDD86DRAFT_228176 [Gorgonomyces haynaldii]|nr:hypothetical protein EDD86DRAFT_228176 [Gorgonomyces haynaldii]
MTILELVGRQVPENRWLEDKYEEQAIEKGSEQKALLEEAIAIGKEDPYREALYLERYRDALLEQAQWLQGNINSEFESRAKFLAPRVYGWTEQPETHGLTNRWQRLKASVQLKSDGTNAQMVYEMLARMEAKSYLLEDKEIADAFFEELQMLLTAEDLKDVPKHVLEKHYPWLKRESELFSHPLLEKKKTKKKVERKPHQEFISTKKFQAYMQEKERQMQMELSKQFRANPLPSSSIMPKYKVIMSTMSNKSAELRQMAAKEKLQEKKEQETKRRICSKPRLTLTAAEDGKRKKMILEENEKKAGLSSEHTFKPKLNHHLPDFEEQQQRFENQLQEKKKSKPKTAPAPFQGLQEHEEQSKIRKEQSANKILQEEREQARQVKAVQLSKKLFDDQKQFVSKTTHAWQLKLEDQKMKKEAQELIAMVEEEERAAQDEQRRILAHKIRSRLGPQKTKEQVDEKRKRYLEDQKRRAEEYRNQLADMNKRILSGMCLFEQEVLKAAQRKAKQDVDMMLKRAGLGSSMGEPALPSKY